MNSFEQLAAAVRADDHSAARALFAAHPELRDVVNQAAPGEAFGGLLIGAATQRRSGSMLDLLIEHGADINARTDWWAGPFHLLETCDIAFAPELIARGAAPDACAAARLGDADRLRRLLDENPAHVHMRGGDGKTPLHYASTVEVAQLLLDRGADINAVDVDHESTAAQYLVTEHPDVARFLVTKGIRTDILLASALGATDLVPRILDQSPDAVRMRVDREWFPMRNSRAGGTIYIWTIGTTKSAFIIAREKGHAETAALIAERAPAGQMLADLALLGDIDAASAVLAKDPSLPTRLSASDAALLSVTVFNANAKGVRFMLDAGWPVRAPDLDGVTALHSAAWHGHANLVGALLAAGADPTAVERRFGGTPLTWAEHGRVNSWLRDRGEYDTVIAMLKGAQS